MSTKKIASEQIGKSVVVSINNHWKGVAPYFICQPRGVLSIRSIHAGRPVLKNIRVKNLSLFRDYCEKYLAAKWFVAKFEAERLS